MTLNRAVERLHENNHMLRELYDMLGIDQCTTLDGLFFLSSELIFDRMGLEDEDACFDEFWDIIDAEKFNEKAFEDFCKKYVKA